MNVANLLDLDENGSLLLSGQLTVLVNLQVLFGGWNVDNVLEVLSDLVVVCLDPVVHSSVRTAGFFGQHESRLQDLGNSDQVQSENVVDVFRSYDTEIIGANDYQTDESEEHIVTDSLPDVLKLLLVILETIVDESVDILTNETETIRNFVYSFDDLVEEEFTILRCQTST